MRVARRFDAITGVRTGVNAGGARPCRCSRTHKHTQAWGAGRGRGERRPYQINERQEFPASSVGLMRGHFDGLVVAQDRAVGQQNRHPQYLARNKRHVHQRPGQAGRRGGRAWAWGRGGAGCAQWAAGRRGRRGGAELWRGAPRGTDATASARATFAGGAVFAGSPGGYGLTGGVASVPPSSPSFCSCVPGAAGDPVGGAPYASQKGEGRPRVRQELGKSAPSSEGCWWWRQPGGEGVRP